MRDLRTRVNDYLTETLPLVAVLLGEGWRAEGHTLVAPDGKRRFRVSPRWYFHCAGTAVLYPAWKHAAVDGDLPTATVAATACPEAIAQALHEELIPAAPWCPPVPVRLSGRAARTAGYLDSSTFENLPEAAADPASALLAGKRTHGFGCYYAAELSEAHARALLEHWDAILEDADLCSNDRRALARDAARLRVRLRRQPQTT